MNKNTEFSARFAEACGTSEPSEIQRLLNIPYQSAKNYLGGRLPTADKLISISEQTSCSIDWLLTGRGKKFVDHADRSGATPPAGQMEAFVRRVCVEVINEMTGSVDSTQPKVVVLQPAELMSEKVEDKAPTPTVKQP